MKKLLYKATRRVVGQGNSACLIVPYKLKKYFFENNKAEGTWYFWKQKDGSLTIEVKFTLMEKSETEKQTGQVHRIKLKPELHVKKDEWVTQGECQKCQKIGNLYQKGERLLCQDCR